MNDDKLSIKEEVHRCRLVCNNSAIEVSLKRQVLENKIV